MPVSTRWLGKALARAQVSTLTLSGTWTAGDTITLAIPDASTGKSIVVTIGSTVTTTQIASEIETAWNETDDTDLGTGYLATERGPEIPEFDEVTALASGSTVVFTGDTKGKPFTLAVTRVAASTGAVSLGATTAATGPNHWDNVVNWSGGALPADGDTVYFDNNSVDVLYGLGQSAIQPAAVYLAMSYTGRIGLPEVNEDGGYEEYRTRFLQLGPVLLRVGDGPGSGSGRILLDSGTDPCALTVVNTGSPEDADVPALVWKGTNAGNTLVMRSGSVGVAVYGAEVATLDTFKVDGGTLVLGRGVTLTSALQVNDGDVAINSLVDGSLTVLNGSVVIDGSGNVDQLTIRGGTVVYKTTGTLGGATVVSGSGVLDFDQDPATKTVSSAIDIHGPNCRILDTDKVVSSLVVDLNEGADASQIVWGSNVKLTRATPS